MNTASSQRRPLFPASGPTPGLLALVLYLTATAAIAAEPMAGVQTERDIPYVEHGHQRQVLDLYIPDQPSGKPRPLVIWIHGGAWMGGGRANPPVLFLLRERIAVASIDYRLSQDAIWPAQIFDCKAAVRYLRANAAKYHLDADHFGVGGDSAGGHLAALVGTSGDAKQLEGELGNPGVSSRVQAVLDWFGPIDLLLMGRQSGPNSLIQHDAPDSPESRLLGGPVQQQRELARTANPLTYLDANAPPFLIMHGDADRVVPLGQSTLLAKGLIDAGVEVTMKTVHGAGHEGPQFHSPEIERQIAAFFSQKLQANENLVEGQ